MKHRLQTLLKHKLQWLVLLTALLGVNQGVCASNEVHGNFSGSWQNTDISSGTANITMNEGTYEFGIRYGGTWYSKTNLSISRNHDVSEQYLATNNGNIRLTADVSGTYTFRIKWQENTVCLWVDFPPSCTTLTTSNYNTSGSWDQVYDGSQKSISITPKSGYPEGDVYYEGKNGTSYTKSKTAPTSSGTYKVTYVTSATSTYCAADLEFGTLTIGTTTVKVKYENSTIASSWGTPYLYYWTEGGSCASPNWESSVLMFYDGSEWYTKILPCKPNRVIFRNTSKNAQTVNVVFDPSKCYIIQSSETDSKQNVQEQSCCTAPTAQSVYIGGSTETSQTICSTSNTYVRLAASQSGYSYQLKRYNTSTSAWNNIGDAWSSNGTGSHDFTGITTAGTYKITGYPTGSSSSCNQDMSNTVTLSVDDESVAGNITGAGSICSGESKTLGVSGNTGTVTQWSSSSTSGGTYNPIKDATASTYSASPESTTYYKVSVKNGVCAAATTSSYATVTVNPAATATEYPISGETTKTYTGSSQGVTIDPAPGTGTYTVYYEGTGGTSYTKSPTGPINVGTYAVTVDANKGDSYCAADGLNVGTLTITAIAPTITLGTISNACGTGDYSISNLASSNSGGSITYSVVTGGTETGTATISGTTLSVTQTGTVKIRASQVANGNYTAGTQDKTFTFAASPVAGFGASAASTSLSFSNTEYVTTTLSTSANSNWDFEWICDSHPTWGTYNTPTIVSSTSNSTVVRFPIEGVYTFHVKAKCKKDDVYVNSTTVTVTVSLPLCIKGPLTESDGDWHSYTSIGNKSDDNTRTYNFTAYNKGTNIREFVLDASTSGDDNHHIHGSDYSTYLNLTNLEVNTSNDNNLRATTGLGISESGTPVTLTVTHRGGKYYDISLALNCTVPEKKTISIGSASVCEGSAVNVTVASSQNGYIYTVYNSNGTSVGTGTGTGNNLNISVTPTASTTYTVKAKQAAACSETAMSNTVSVTVNERPTFSPSTGITQYLPVTVTSNAATPSWSIASKSPDVDAAWISSTTGTSTVLKAPTGTYTVSDGTCTTETITVSDDSETCP